MPVLLQKLLHNKSVAADFTVIQTSLKKNPIESDSFDAKLKEKTEASPEENLTV